MSERKGSFVRAQGSGALIECRNSYIQYSHTGLQLSTFAPPPPRRARGKGMARATSHMRGHAR